MNIRNTPRSQNGMLHSVLFTELFVKNNSRQRKNFPSENSTIISALARSAQTYEALPVSMIRRAGLIQKLRILRSFSCNVKCDSVVCAADVGRQHSCLLRSFSCNAIFQFFNVTGSLNLTGSITILLRRSAYPYVHQLCSIFVIIVVTIKYTYLYSFHLNDYNRL